MTSIFKGFQYRRGVYSEKDFIWLDDQTHEANYASWGFAKHSAMTFGNEFGVEIKVFPQGGSSEKPRQEVRSYLVEVNLGDQVEIIEVDALPSLIEILKDLVPLATAAIQQEHYEEADYERRVKEKHG